MLALMDAEIAHDVAAVLMAAGAVRVIQTTVE
jgi:hypothetical protein